MKRPILSGVARTYRLPQFVERGSLGKLAQDLSRDLHRSEIVLDFTSVNHIDFRAFRRFAAATRL